MKPFVDNPTWRGRNPQSADRCRNGLQRVRSSVLTSLSWFAAAAVLLTAWSAEAQIPTPQIGDPSYRDSIAIGGSHTLALKTGGSLWAWGNNYYGQLGDGTTISRETPVRLEGCDWRTVTAGDSHTLGLRADRSLWAWGANPAGQLGTGSFGIGANVPTQVGIDDDWADVATSSSHTVALKIDGSLWAWGANQNGQLGDGTSESRDSPVRIGNDVDWKAITAGGSSTLALKIDGSLWAWGWFGTPGGFASIPTRVGTGNDWAKISSGSLRALAVKEDGSLWQWQWAWWIDSAPSFVQVAADYGWVTANTSSYSISSGGGPVYEFLDFAIKSDGSLWRRRQADPLWPDDSYQTNFVRVGTNTGWASVAGRAWAHWALLPSGPSFVGLKTDGTLWRSPSQRIDNDIDWGSSQTLRFSNEFRIARHRLGSDGRFRAVVGPLSNNCYSVLYRSPTVTNLTEPVDLRLLPCARAHQLTDSTPATTNASAFYRVRQVPIAQPLDLDGDGIDDVYELRHAGFLNSLDGSDAGQDFDGDGRSNLEEYREGTEPEMP